MGRRRDHPAGFSLIELVIVVVITGVIAAIAVPRVGSASENSMAAAQAGSLKVLNNAVELYAAEHNGRSPAAAADGSPDTSAGNLVSRLTVITDADGVVGAPAAIFGPYLRAIPRNPFNGLATIRIDGAIARAGTHGWQFDTARRAFQADDAAATGTVVSGGSGGAAATGGAANDSDGH